MDRRDVLTGSSILGFAALLTEVASGAGLSPPTQPSAAPTGPFRFGRTSNSDVVAGAYKAGARDTAASVVPYLIAFYDEDAKKFIKPLGWKPTLAKGNYTLEMQLHSFNVRSKDKDKFRGLKNVVQLGVNASAPVSSSDRLSWIFMNAIDIFLAKDNAGREDQLTKFTNSAGKSTTPLAATPKVNVTNGTVQLQFTAYGQKRDSFWTKLINAVASIAKSPLVSTASKGFAIPALASEAVGFVNGVMNTIAAQDNLVPLWETDSLTFGVTNDVTSRFGLRPGLIAVVDSDYAQKTNFLENHTIDLDYESFRIVDQTKNQVDTNYLVTEILKPEPTNSGS